MALEEESQCVALWGEHQGGHQARSLWEPTSHLDQLCPH